MIASGAFYMMVSRVAFVLSGYAIHVTMAHLLVPADYGTLGVIVGLITLWRVFLSAGIPQTTTRFIAADERQTYWIWRRALRIQAGAALVLWAAYVVGTPLWVRLLNDASLTPYILLSSLLIPLMAWYQVNLAYFTGRLQFRRQAWNIGLYSIARVALAIALVVIGLKIYGVILGMMLAALLAAVTTHAAVPREPRGVTPLPDWRQVLAFSAPLVFVSFGVSALLNLDLLLLKHFFPRSELIGYYNGAMNLGKAPYWVLSAFATTALPSIAQALGTADAERARALVRRHTTYVLLISVPAMALAIPSAGRLLELVYPEPYVVAAPALQVLLCSAGALALLTVLTSSLTAAGQPRSAMAIVLACTLLQLVTGAALVPRYAMLGAAAANLAAVLLGLLAGAWAVRARFGGLVEGGRVLKALAVSMPIGAGLGAWHGYPPLAVPVIYMVGGVLYVAAMYVIGGFTAGEIESARRIVRRLRRSEQTLGTA